jgi:hypothetical protein
MNFFNLGASRRSSGNWDAIRDLEVREARIQAEIDLARLGEERNVLSERQWRIELELERMGESEAGVRTHSVLGRRWGLLCLAAVGIAVGSAWWTVNWFLTLGWERALLAVTLFVLPLVGWVAFLSFVGEQASAWDLRKILSACGLLVVLCSAVAVACLGGARMAGVTLQEERHADHVEFSDNAATVQARHERVTRIKGLLSRLATAAVIILSVAGEVAAGIAYHEYARHRVVVRTVGSFFNERRSIAQALADNAAAREAVARSAELLEARLTATGLRREAVAVYQAEEKERRDKSVVPTLKWVAIVFGVLVLLLFAVSLVLAAEAVYTSSGITVVILDLSTSVDPDNEFQRNVQAIDYLISSVPAGNTRLVVLGLDSRSFSRAPLFSGASPSDAGRFGEYLESWRIGQIRAWRQVAARLKPDATGSDVIGAVARAALEFEDRRDRSRRLIILSDMRQVGRGLNFERRIDNTAALIEWADRQGLICRLPSVEVWALGVHTLGAEERQWVAIRMFWTEYFRRAGAVMKSFSPSRHMGER